MPWNKSIFWIFIYNFTTIWRWVQMKTNKQNKNLNLKRQRRKKTVCLALKCENFVILFWRLVVVVVVSFLIRNTKKQKRYGFIVWDLYAMTDVESTQLKVVASKWKSVYECKHATFTTLCSSFEKLTEPWLKLNVLSTDCVQVFFWRSNGKNKCFNLL